MKDKLIFIIITSIFRILLDYCYQYLISPIYTYVGFDYIPSIEGRLYSWIILVLFAFFVHGFIKKRHTFSGMVALMMFFLRFVPLTSFFACYTQPLDYFMYQCIFYAVLFLTLFYFNFSGIYNIINNNEKLVTVIICIIAFNIIFISGYYCNFRLHFALDDVYDLRHEARTFNIPLPVKYLWMAGNNVLPIMVIYCFEKHKKYFAAFLIFVCLLNFGINGLKSTLFKVILCVMVYKFYRNNFVKLLGSLFVLLCAVSIAEFIWLHNTSISDILIRRMFFIPARLDLCYYEYTVQHGPIYFNTHLADRLPYLIGAQYMGDGVNANNGLFSDAFAKYGFGGIILYPIVVSLFIAWCDKVSRKIDESLTFYVAFVFATTLISSALTTSLFSHGLFLTIIIIMMVAYQNTPIRYYDKQIIN